MAGDHIGRILSQCSKSGLLVPQAVPQGRDSAKRRDKGRNFCCVYGVIQSGDFVYLFDQRLAEIMEYFVQNRHQHQPSHQENQENLEPGLMDGALHSGHRNIGPNKADPLTIR